jgi:hypothetical protein
MSILHEQLAMRALAALYEIADTCGSKPAERNLSLRFILAYTFVAAGADPKLKWLWDSFWADATSPLDPTRSLDEYLRATGARSALTGICREMGYPTSVGFFEQLRNHGRTRRSPRAGEEDPGAAPVESSGSDVGEKSA